MGRSTLHSLAETSIWALVRKQHGVVARWQLLALNYTAEAIQHRIEAGRLYCLYPGVYAVGRREVTVHGRWTAAVLACGDGAALSHETAAALWQMRRRGPREIHVSVPFPRNPSHPGIHPHRRKALAPSDLTERHGIPVTTPACTLIDLATSLPRDELEAAINKADKLDLIDPDELRDALDATPPRPGVRTLRTILDRHTFTLTDSWLERRFLPIARAAGLPRPQTQVYVNGFKVDFYWPGLGLVVETDGLRYHRTPAEQARDRLRDQAHSAAGLTPLRFTRAQVKYEPGHVEATLAAVVATRQP